MRSPKGTAQARFMSTRDEKDSTRGRANALRDVLDGLESPYADAVLLNAAAMLMLADKAPSLHEGVALARSTIARGEARKKLEQLIEASFCDE